MREASKVVRNNFLNKTSWIIKKYGVTTTEIDKILTNAEVGLLHFLNNPVPIAFIVYEDSANNHQGHYASVYSYYPMRGFEKVATVYRENGTNRLEYNGKTHESESPVPNIVYKCILGGKGITAELYKRDGKWYMRLRKLAIINGNPLLKPFHNEPLPEEMEEFLKPVIKPYQA